MPLLRKQPFQRLHVSSDFKDDDEVFHCEVTNEIFKDYNEFCERIILCNSLIWSCSITGRTNMTFEEALQCEENAKRSLKEFPMELRIPILYLASKTNRSSFKEMIEDVYQFARDRYFVGEMVEASFTEDSWCDCHVLQVIAPSEQQIKLYNKENNSLLHRSPQEQQYHPPAKLFRYEVEQLDSGDSDVSQLMIVEAAQVRRRKQHYSKERNKIFLRQLCEQNESGIWIIKDSVLQKYGINKVRFDTIFAGPPPDFTSRIKKPVKHKQESIDKFLTTDVSKQKLIEKPNPLKKVNQGGVDIKKFRKPRMNGKFKEDLKAKALEEKAKRKEERVLQNERKKEEKQKSAALAAYIRQWNKPREDLECEDLSPIPEATPVKSSIPNEKFGDSVMILEFLEFFNEELEVSAYFPNGFTLDLLEKALLLKETSGPWSDLLQLLLANIFKYQTDEEDEIHAQASDITNDISTNEGASSMTKAVKLSTIASSWSQVHQGCKLSELTLDHVTLSEILRQHLLCSGGRIGDVATKWRYSQRGGYTNQDDPALFMRINETYILRLLGHCSVHEFELGEKLKVATCLINQLLTFASIRDVIEERREKLHQAKKELKSFLIAEQRKEKEEKERMRDREKDNDGKIPKKVTRGSCEEEKKKEEYENKLKELQEASRDNKMMVYLGSDRAHRRYWRFLSIPGIFVENDEWWSGNCIPDGTPYQPELLDTEAMHAYLKNKFEDEFSDKENSFKKAKRSPKKVSFSDKNILKSPRKDISRKEFKQELFDIRKNLMACTGDKECPVHCKRSELKWSFFGKPEDIEALVNGLSKRGIREGELRNNIIQEMPSLMSVIEECPRHKLNPEVFSEPIKVHPNRISKKNRYENANLNFPSEMAVNIVLELTLRDYILDFEDRVKGGALGNLKVNDREIWRHAINNRKYDKQCDKLVYGTNEIEADIVSNTSLDKIKNETKHSRPGTPDSEVGSINTKTYKDAGKYLGPPSENEMLPDPNQQLAIKQMACAILQLSHAIEQKYLQKPLGATEKDKKWFGEDIREKWEQSLMASASWSQLFVHLSTLENSVAWSRSALNAQCRICRRRRDGDKMLLCDGCNKGHHLYCLQPKLNSVPDGDWYCKVCKPPTKPKEKIKKRKKFEDELEEDVILTKETRHNRAKRVLESEEEGDSVDEELEEDSDDDMGSQQINVCCICKSGGKLISCDTCSNFYHVECIEPPLTRAPRGRWVCSDCKDRKDRKTNIRYVRGRERERDKERLCAAAARSRIHGFAKSLLTTESTDWDDSSTSEDTEPRQTRRAAKRAAEIEQEEDKGTIKGCMGRLQELLSDIRHHRDSWPFLSPVTKDEVPDYHDIISNPMDFGTIKYKLNNNEYETLEHFFSDCHLVFENCQAYNEEHSSVYKAGIRLLKYYEKRCKELGLTTHGEELLRPPDTKKPKFEENGLTVSEDEEAENIQKSR
ncbi:bromodomain adjacent to zinc finger domain protein 1A isoform X3 [Bombus impatiens]|uniref:Bromodomain adjacent to zinc finger domain protein 1A n=1 Tax=Bombus impatiens TaxID=132113 RepID=A0A6P3UTK9_BOMIM|nr:bromodomain adjacent to zinc finger domain protein 1A isoform X3 [Bombus impatiens]XP_050487049.1 bromodomain adjacent to zinc finger domain protein 1A isoform X3 [Bombus huntii]